MTVAVSVSAGEGAQAVVCASTGNTSASAAAYAARAGLRPVVLLAGRQDRRRQAGAGHRPRSPGRPDRGKFRRLSSVGPPAGRALPGVAREFGESRTDRRPEDGRLRDRRRPRRRAGPARPAGGQRWEHLGLLAWLHRVRGGGSRRAYAAHVGLPGRRGGAPGPGSPGAVPGDRRHRDPDREPRLHRAGGRRATRIRWPVRGGDRRGNPCCASVFGRSGGRVRRAGIGRRRGGSAGPPAARSGRAPTSRS